MLDRLGKFFNFGFGTPILLLIIMAMIILPLPPFLLDVFFTFNIVLSLIVLMASIYSKRPLDFAAFPTVILIATLFRLALNLASTRVVLLNGHEGGDAAGKVIEAFGSVVIGGNYAVGMIVFSIMVIINFVVVTKGTGRVAEVSARFTLDAMPGKQMAIDADLSAGSIDQAEAKQKRDDLSVESDFYGSMDGASKFVKGDAIAGILVLFINIIGGLIIGMSTHGLDASTAAEFYVLLTIGDGLAAQIPSLLLSTATAIIVTRVSSSKDMGSDIASQLGRPKGLFISGSIIGLIGLIPGMPNLMFLMVATILFTLYYFLDKANKDRVVSDQKDVEESAKDEPTKELAWDDLSEVDDLSIEVGYRLISLVDTTQGGHLIDKIKGIRKKISTTIGFLIPSVHIKDNLDLDPDEYKIFIMGLEVGVGNIEHNKHLAINPGEVYGDLNGTVTSDPAYGLPAVWINENLTDKANSFGYTVVDPGTVIATHISRIINDNLSSFFGRDEVQNMINKLEMSNPKLVGELKSEDLNFGLFVRTLQKLLSEDVSLLQFKSIASSYLNAISKSTDEEDILKLTREGIGKFIVSPLLNNGELNALALEPQLEQILLSAVEKSMQTGNINIEPTIAEKLGESLKTTLSENASLGDYPTVLAPANLRSLLSGFFRHMFPEIHVLSYNEVPATSKINFIGSIG
jgi:flagellar biosynthesis protein FlhA